MFEADGIKYTLKFNERKLDGIEAQTDKSIMAELKKTSGLLSNGLLRTMFVSALVEEDDEKPVKGQKATDIYNKVKEENGYAAVVNATVNKFMEDMGFLFR